MRLDRARVVAVVGELIAAGRAVGVSLEPGSAAAAARSTMRKNPGADSSARVPRPKRMVIATFPLVAA